MNKISVLIPTCKPQAYFIECLNAIQAQTLEKDFYKVYVCLNGERDPYFDYIREALTRLNFQFEFFYLHEASVSLARNLLLEKAKEKFVVFIDDDDLVSPGYLAEMLKVSSAHTMVISRIYNFRVSICERRLNYIGQTFNQLIDGEASKFKTRKYFSSACAKLLHRDIIASSRFDPKLTKGEDSLFMAEISKNVMSIRKADSSASYYVRERVGSVTRRKIHRVTEIKMLIYLLGKFLKILIAPGYQKSFICSRLLATAAKFFRVFRGGFCSLPDGN
jgi:glycosyltransferase involved in cell wall biosynthesis